ncbi:hypothetical protein 1 [Hubei sobemo-like virus 31]|uniref:hypothetical protein 1 n=1 Tax=Hubei sobemo-like virus 31 TaxID=1923218 RepID=UPI00090BE597|nr:hypothetical protein 1 [Hubei sobemo-like virus 31]APG75915.1 hypothetical protein 1 [Hubei sobemo-like virus 31]
MYNVIDAFTYAVLGYAATQAPGLSLAADVIWRSIKWLFNVSFRETKAYLKPPTRREVMRDWANRLVERGLAEINAIQALEWSIIGLVLVLLVLVWKRGRRTVHRIRGIKYEAMMANSHFHEGKPLECQVAILIPGLLTDKHNGYGFRVEDFLVVPKHVVAGKDEIMLKNLFFPEKKLMISTAGRIDSKLNVDLSYILLTKKSWSTVGVSKSSIIAGTKSLMQSVTIYGPKGVSEGALRHTNMIGQLAYTGSTIPGMSGSVYTSEGRVLGMHTGAFEKKINVGLAGSMIKEEVKYLTVVQLESSEELLEVAADNGDWNDAMMNGYVNDKYSQRQYELDQRYLEDKKAKEEEEKAYTKRFYARLASGEIDDWTSDDFLGESAIKLARQLVERADRKKKTIKAESSDGEDIPLQDMALYRRLTDMEATIERLAERLAFVENRLCRETAMGQVVGYRCDECRTSCTTAEKLENHKKAAHPKVEKYPCPSCDTVCNTQAKLSNHMLSNHIPKIELYQCPLCNDRLEKEALMQHISKHQPEAAEEAKEAVAFLGRERSSNQSSRNGSTSWSAERPRQADQPSPYRSTTEYLKKKKPSSGKPQ